MKVNHGEEYKIERGKNTQSGGNQQPWNGPQTADARKFKNPNMIQGIVPLPIEQMVTPVRINQTRKLVQTPRQQSTKSWADVVEEEAESSGQGKSQTLSSSWSKIVGPIPEKTDNDLLTGNKG